MVYTNIMSRYKLSKIYEWNGQLAYLAGLIASDGCLINNGRHLNITSIDREIIDYAQSILGKEKLKVQPKTGQYGTPAFAWQFSDVSLYDFFIQHGITPQKSKTIKSVDVPDEYWCDFLRGYFDGDGTVYGYFDKRWKNSFMFYCGFASASDDFLVWLRGKNTDLIGVGKGSIRKSTRVKLLGYAKADSRLIHSAIYGDKTCSDKYSLIRKRVKFDGFINRG